MHGLTLGGVTQLLRRLGVSWQRGRAAIGSPDPDYDAKRAYLAQLRAEVAAAPERVVVCYLDEVTIERQPTVAASYAPRGGQDQPRARLSHASNTLTRLVATLTHGTGQVVFRRASKIRLTTLVQFYGALRAAYPWAERIYVVQDNWPVHTHPDVLVALEAQTSPFAFHRPPSWPTTPRPAAVTRWQDLALPIQIVPLPTYASWCNPIEKLWRKLRQEVTHLHRWAQDLPALHQALDSFLGQFAQGSAALLRYVGLAKWACTDLPD
jgi:transposase